MPVVSVRIPQLGEGLQEALLVEFLKQPGDVIKRDEPIYVMETDKATSEVESPYDGTLVEWVVKEGQVLEIGTEIAKMDVAEGVKEMPAGHEPSSQSAAPTANENSANASADTSANVHEGNGGATATAVRAKAGGIQIPPRTRKYLKEKGLLDRIDEIPAIGKKLMPDDVDRFLAGLATDSTSSSDSMAQASQPAKQAAEPQSTDEYDEQELERKQQTLNYRLTRGAQLCVPVTVMTDVDWTGIDRARAIAKTTNGPSGFSMMLWCVTRALARHSRFRSTLSTDGRIIRTYHHAKLGIAVSRPGDELLTAVVENADQLPPTDFYQRVSEQIEKAREGEDQADAATTISVSNIGSAGMKVGIPAIVAPAVATLALGAIFDHPVPSGDSFEFQKRATLSLSFDHRVINGVGGAEFLSDVKKEIEAFQWQPA